MKVTFVGAGSTVFAKNILGDLILMDDLGEFEIALYDIDFNRLDETYVMLNKINHKYNGKAKITKYHNRKEAFKNSTYIINAIQVGGYEPCTVWDFEIPKKYGLRHTIADTMGVGGIMRALRTIPVLDSMAKEIKEVAPNSLFINLTNPMAMLTIYIEKVLKLKTIGLCHSVQVCVKGLFETLDMMDYYDTCTWEIAGINHQAWLLKIQDQNGTDLYPEIKKRSLDSKYDSNKQWDLVRHDMMHRFGYYITESSEHNAEYSNWYIKSKYPELIKKYNIPLDEYPRRCVEQIKDWDELKKEIVYGDVIHNMSNEYAAKIIRAIELNDPFVFHGNVLNNDLIKNLPNNCSVEVPCVADKNGIRPISVENLPEICAAINRTNINVQTLLVEAAISKQREDVYKAAYLDMHTSSELSLDDIKNMMDELLDIQSDYHDIK
ncbi:MAG: alpha-glucosidase/alpha-galactosidase [Acholeplasmataceae bacterium]